MNAMKKDAHDFIMKPASIDTIIEKINTAYEAGAISGRKTRSRK
jgi:FixJ family two-component response regulator